MNKVTTLEQAREYFIHNATGAIKCFKDNESRICNSFPEAQDFYYSTPTTDERRSDDDDSTSIGLGFMTGAVMGDVASSIEASNPDPIPEPDTSSSFDSGGGDFGGGGGGSDF